MLSWKPIAEVKNVIMLTTVQMGLKDSESYKNRFERMVGPHQAMNFVSNHYTIFLIGDGEEQWCVCAYPSANGRLITDDGQPFFDYGDAFTHYKTRDTALYLYDLMVQCVKEDKMHIDKHIKMYDALKKGRMEVQA